MRIRTVLCPLDFSALDEREIGVSRTICRTFGAKLVLHHDVAAAEPGFSRAWEWAKAHVGDATTGRAVEARLQAMLDRVVDVPAEARVTSGPLVQTILALAEALPADLVVLGSHGWSTPDHASVTERLIDRAPCPVLTFQERAFGRAFRLRSGAGEPAGRAVVPTDLSEDSAAAVGYACALAREAGVQVDLLHVLPADTTASALAAARQAMDALVPTDLVDPVRAHIRRGEPASEIVRYLEVTAPDFAVLGEHARGILGHLLTRDTTRAVVREGSCPVWVVPSRFAA